MASSAGRAGIMREELKRRILVLDGAMGTMIQRHELSEEDFRGQRFAETGRPLLGANDLLCLSQPDLIRSIHAEYLQAGADLIETNTFNANRISLADYGLEEIARELNHAAAQLARAAADEAEARDSSRTRWVVGALGPTNRTASISPDVGDPGARNVTFDELVEAYQEQSLGLLEGGVDILMVETAFDTLNAKAALYALSLVLADWTVDTPVMVSGRSRIRAGAHSRAKHPRRFTMR